MNPGMARFAGKVAMITGAAQGIGKAIALRLAAEHAQVVLVDRASDGCQQLADEIRGLGGQAECISVDLETREGARSMVKQALDRCGSIDVSVHNVGGTIWSKPFWEYDDEEMEKEISRSLWPTLRCCRAVLPVMLEQGHGAIVNIGSIATRGIYRVPYSAAKGGVHAITACLAMELADSGVRINCVAPGGVEQEARKVPRNPQPPTEQEKAWRAAVAAQTLRDTPMMRRGKVDEIASAVCYLASDDASYVTGQVLFLAGGGAG